MLIRFFTMAFESHQIYFIFWNLLQYGTSVLRCLHRVMCNHPTLMPLCVVSHTVTCPLTKQEVMTTKKPVIMA